MWILYWDLYTLDTFIPQTHGAKKGILVQMTCYTADYLSDLKTSNEIEEIGWLNTKDMNRISPVDKKIVTYLKQNGLLG